MSENSKWEYFKAIYQRYRKATPAGKKQILNGFCQICNYNRKYAIAKLNGAPPEELAPKRRKRSPTYSPQMIGILKSIWERAGYPWSVRLKALLPLWLPWAQKRFPLTPQIQPQLLSISPRQIDRRLKNTKLKLRRRLYGRTKPGTLLKHHIPIKTDSWDVKSPGFAEVDLVSHSGNSEKGEFLHSLNLTDIHPTWVESRAVMGKGQTRVLQAMEEIQQALPFQLLGIDSDNGSEFINYHFKAFCDHKGIQFTCGRPYKKDDNAHIEQKNWTHVRKLLGYLRYDSLKALQIMNDLYRKELSWMMNLYQPSVRLIQKVRVGSKIKRVYDKPQTPLDRLLSSQQGDPTKLEELKRLRHFLDPFKLSQSIDEKLDRLYELSNPRHSPRPSPHAASKNELSPVEKQALRKMSEAFGIKVYVGKSQLPQG